jgi:hypothetical protein
MESYRRAGFGVRSRLETKDLRERRSFDPSARRCACGSEGPLLSAPKETTIASTSIRCKENAPATGWEAIRSPSSPWHFKVGDEAGGSLHHIDYTYLIEVLFTTVRTRNRLREMNRRRFSVPILAIPGLWNWGCWLTIGSIHQEDLPVPEQVVSSLVQRIDGLIRSRSIASGEKLPRVLVSGEWPYGMATMGSGA